MPEKYIYGFGGGGAEGSGEQRALLGGKGAGLAEMSRLGIPVPPGFTVATEVCGYYHEHEAQYPAGLDDEFDQHLRRLEELLDRRFGDPERPLTVSVRSGGPISMPGMMDTILNLGLNDEIVAAQKDSQGDPRFLQDCYRRLISMYSDVVLGVPHRLFEEVLTSARAAEGVSSDAELSVEALDRVVAAYLDLVKGEGKPMPQDPRQQLWGAVGAVFESWNNRRACEYRRLHGITDNTGTAVNVQVMVFGNNGPRSATGVAFTRNPASGERRIYGEYLINAQGEDVVAGIRTPKSILPSGDGSQGLESDFPEAWRELEEVCKTLEEHFREMQDVEFTIDEEELYMLQTRSGKRTGPAAIRIAVEMAEEGLIDHREALRRVEAGHLVQMLAPVFDAAEMTRARDEGRLLARGLPAGPGAAAGRIAFTAERAVEMASQEPVLLVRDETSPEDIAGMHAAAGILTARGGMTSHAAVVARGLGKPCVVGAEALHVDESAGVLRVGDQTLEEGAQLSIDGTSGEVLAGALKAQPSEVIEALVEGGRSESAAVQVFREILSWADEERRLKVRANADTPQDAAVARALGAEGIGLCRTEHMFFGDDRLPVMQRMILARDGEERASALAQLLPLQQGDFEGIFAALEGLPVTVRLLDPPLHEFLPRGERAVEQLAAEMEVEVEELAATVRSLAEANPMLGHRGCRLAFTAPEIYDMQVEAIVRAACARHRADEPVKPEIMVPLVGTEEEIAHLRSRVQATVERVLAEEGVSMQVEIGTMIEIPRAALLADRIARHADFFSFGTNDLTQMTYGYSRDDAGRFLPDYLEGGILPFDPFARLDGDGVGQLVELACQRGRSTRADLKLGICGEHGGDDHSVVLFEQYGLDYVSCSPYRIPVARLAAARARLGYGA
jgi:pyruvate,orthophosphate dikinase